MDYIIRKQQSDTGADVFIFENQNIHVPLNSLYSPEKEANRFLTKLSSVQKSLVIVIGFGNGALLDSLLSSKTFENNIHFLFIEPFSEIKLTDQQIAIFKMEDKISFTYLEHFSALIFVKYISKFISIPVTINVHPNYLKANEPLIKDCLNVIREGTETKQILDNTEMNFALDWIIEPLLNINYLPESINIKNLKGKFSGERALLIASGPSLNEHMNFIKAKQNSFHTFAVGSSLRALLANDIQPDYVLSIDASNTNYETHFQDLDYTSTLIYETMSNSNIQKHHHGSLIISKAGTDYVTSQAVNDLFSFPQTSPSVAIFTLQVIAYLGFSEVYLIGQDLALVDGEYYASDIKQHEGMMNLEDELWVESNEGRQVGTTRSLKIFLDTFETLIHTLPEDLSIFNLSRQGAKINGTTYIDSKEINEGTKHEITINNELIYLSKNPTSIITEFIENLLQLKLDCEKANNKIKRLVKIGAVSSDDMQRIVKQFRLISGNTILTEIILSKLTFMFDRIINKFAYLEEKQHYTNDDLLSLIIELESFYDVVIKYSDDLIKDERLGCYKKGKR
ncbi:DUF115 domain-containing protein [Psychrobacillus psychrodurans]|uniref:motility associated factor glycosyltransferase family protein n=1 Tax=Psychrobacillus psychrodurans TaxID=126157 RepID=UPI001F4E6026|nr:6-hydroxymethylpterin diphosphokinase MptE-like protein [Psychrobacillus psychrodurans]MCK1995975.1 DUF115 domain-containing protein [Psychrobacillus psychrodurans]